MSTVTLAGWVVEKSDGEGGWTTLPCEFRVFSPRLNDEDSLEFALPNTAANLAWVDTEPVLQIKLGGSVKWTGKLLDYDASDDEIVCTCYDAVYDALDVAEPVTGKYEAPTAANTILAAILTDTGISLGDCPTTEITIRYEKASPFNLVKYIARQVLGVDYYSSSGTTINLGTRGSTQTFSGVGAIFSPRAKSKKQKRTKIYIRGADVNGVRLYGSAGAGNRVGVYNDRRATDQTTLDSIAANKLAELNTDDLATTFTVTIDKAKDLMPGDTIPITDAQRGLDGDYRITAIDFTEAEATISIIVYKKDTAERLNELEQAAEDIGIYPIVNEQLDNPSGAPAAITDLAAVEEFSGVRLDWTSNTENDLAGYIVYRDTTPTATTEYMRVNSNQVLDKNITYGVTYYYRVKPFDRAGNLGDFSNEASVAPKKLETVDVTDGAILAAKLAKGIQAFSSNIVFSPYTGAEDSKVSWAAGTIVFADGTTQDIDAGATNVLTPGTEYYVYFVVGEAALSVTSTYSDALGDTKGLLAIIGRSGTAGQQVFIQPFAGKGLNINADVLAARCVKTANLDAGAVTADKVTLNGITETGDLDLAEIGSGTLDDVPDGTSFKKVAAAALNESGLILLAEAVQTEAARLVSDTEKGTWNAKPDNMDEISDGVSYKRVAAAALDVNGLVLLSKVSGDLDDVADGTSFKKVAAASLTAEGLVLLSAVSGTLDDVADGENYGKVAVTDISAGHILLSACLGDLDDIADGTYGKVLSTDISSGHILLSSVVTDANHRYTTDAEKAAWNAKPEDMDALGDGVTYGKVLKSALSEGLVLLSKAVGDLDDVAEGTTYGKVLKTDISAGHIVLSSVVGDLDDVADGTLYAKVLATDISAGHILLSSVVTDANHRYTTDAEKAAWNAKPENMDEISDGVTYAKVLATDISAGHILLSECIGDLDDIADGTYGKVLATDISAGHILLSSVITDSNHRVTTDAEKAAWTAKPDNMDQIADGSTYKKVLATDISAGHILLSSVITDSNHRVTTDAEKASWNSKPENMDQIADGSTYGKVLSTSISAGKIVVAGLADDVKDRMFSDSTARANIEAWRKSGSPTSIDGAYIYARTIVAEKIVCVGSWSMPIKASDVLQHNNQTRRVVTTVGSWHKIKEIKVNDGFNQTPGESFRLKVTLEIGAYSGGSLLAKVYKNGSAISSEQSVLYSTVEVSWDITTPFYANDLIQIYCYYNPAPASSASVSDMKLCYGPEGLPMSRSVTDQDP